MKAIQGQSNPKFVRRCSLTTWENSTSTCVTQLSDTKDKKTEGSIIITPTKNVYTISQKSQFIPLIRSTQTHLIKVEGDGIRIGGEPGISDESKVQQCKSWELTNNNPQQQTFSGIYLPIQKQNRFQSLPTIRKKGTEINQYCLQTKRKQSVSYKNQDIQKLLRQNQSFLQSEAVKNRQIINLNTEICNLKLHNKKLQDEKSQLKTVVAELEDKICRLTINCDQMRKKLEDLQIFKIKQDDIVKELTFNMKKIELQIKAKKQQIQQLTLIIQKSPSLNRREQKRVGSQQAGQIEKAKIYSVQNKQQNWCGVSNGRYKCNRFIQTESCKLQVALKQNENLVCRLRNQDKTIKVLQKDIHCLSKKVKILEEMQQKLKEEEKLIGDLNSQIMKAAASKLAVKYKYF